MARKRASMREGPLAELFRATEAAQKQGQPKDEPPREEPQEPIEETVPHVPDLVNREAAPVEAPEEPPGEEPPPEREERTVRWIEPLPERAPRLHRVPAPDSGQYLAMIRVVGVGRAGLNAIDRMIDAGLSQVEFVAVNTDIQQLSGSDAEVKTHIGRDLAAGLGSGAYAEAARRAAEDPSH